MKTNTLFTLTFVVGLLVSSSIAAPISPERRVSKRDEVPAGCPGTLRGPSGNSYYAFSSTLNNKVAQQACASCYNGVLADITSTDMQFLTENLEQTSWIKSWNGDDYSSSCLTLQPNGGGVPTVGVDSTCAVEGWPLCQTAQAAGTVMIEALSGSTFTSLAVPYTPSRTDDVGPADPEATTTSDEVAAVELEVSIPSKTEEISPADIAAVEVIASKTEDIPTKTSEDSAFDPEATYKAPGGNIVAEAEVEIISPSRTEPEAVPDPETTCSKPGHIADADAEVEVVVPTKTEPDAVADPVATYDTPGHGVAEAEVEVEAVVPTKSEPEAAADPEATYDKPGNIVAEVEVVVPAETEPETAAIPEAANDTPDHNVAEVEAVEVVAANTETESLADPSATTTGDALAAEVVAVDTTPAQGASPAPAVAEEDPLMVRKEKVRAAFEEDKEACSAELAMGEQDPITNEYEIEHMSDHAACSSSSKVIV